MTDEEIISAAEATGLKLITLGLDKQKSEFLILAFAKFVGKIERLKEREACAKVCEQEQEYWGWDKVIDAAKIIRARGKA